MSTAVFDSNINNFLIHLGLMNGQYHDGMIRTTKFGVFNQRICISICIFSAVKWFFLLFHSEEEKIAHQLGDFTSFFGPKIIISLLIIFASIHILVDISYFYFCSKKLLFWLDSMEYDSDDECFHKLNLIRKCLPSNLQFQEQLP